MTRALLIGALVVVVAGLAVCGGGYWWLQAHKDELTAAAKNSFADGAHFGSGKPAFRCVEEAEKRLAHVDGIIAEASNKQFLTGCLKLATLTPGFCDGVPAPGDIMKSASWDVERCASVPQQQPCTRLIGAVQERCSAH